MLVIWTVLLLAALLLTPWLLWIAYKRRMYSAKPTVGSCYVVKVRSNTYAIMKVVAIDKAGVHIMPYANRYTRKPLESDLRSLTAVSTTVCISPKRFALLLPRELGKVEVTEAEREMHRQKG